MYYPFRALRQLYFHNFGTKYSLQTLEPERCGSLWSGF